jgi:hypothetical protein
VLMRRFIDCVLIHHDHRGTNVLLRHPMRSPAPDRSPSPPTRGARPAGPTAPDRRLAPARHPGRAGTASAMPAAPLLLASYSRDPPERSGR